VQLAAGLAALGHEVRVLGRGGEGARGPKLAFPLAIVGPARRAARDFRPHVAQVHESDGAFAARALRRLGRSGGPRPVLVALQQVSYVEERRAVRPLVDPLGRILGRPTAVERRFRAAKAPLQILLGRWTVRWVDRVLAPSAATAAELERDYGARDVRVVPNAKGPAGGDARPHPAAGDPRDFFLFVGRLRIRKGVEVLLAALAELARSGRDARLLVAGEGEHRDAVERAIRDLGLGERARCLGRADAAQVRWLLERARALVVPSIYEGMPLVVLEAMEAGRAVIASRVSGIPEVVRDGETGWLVPAEDPAALATTLARARDRPAEVAALGRAGRALLEREYRPPQIAARWLAAIGGEIEEATRP
jgi:glycosyltransferase involved in cell wall biosynthesis